MRLPLLQLGLLLATSLVGCGEDTLPAFARPAPVGDQDAATPDAPPDGSPDSRR